MPKVLVIDDDKEVLKIISIAFTKTSSIEINSVNNANDAIDFLKREENVDLIITDLMMPVIDGFKLIEILKTDMRLKNVPIIVLSIKTSHEDKVRCLMLGVSGFINKPFNPIELRRKVEEYILFNTEEALLCR